jgi:mono/diheme cytochrome c family protein
MRIILTTLTLACLSAAAALAADAKAGQAVYDKSCKSCHGADGSGNPAIAKMMKVDMKSLGSAEVQALSDGDLGKIVTDGKGKMKPVKTVSGPAVDNVVAYVRSLKK